MKYYKINNEIRAIGEKGDIDGDQSKLIQKDWIEISYDEMMEITNPPKTQEELNAIKIKEAKDYLSSTDWVVVKIQEQQVQGLDVSDLLIQYSDVLTKRSESRDLINTLESNEGAE